MRPLHKHTKVIIGGGGTGGHIFPAISIADELKRRDQNVQILFVGAMDRMEMERVPASGYEIKGLPVSGFQRKLAYKNFVVLYNLFRSIILANRIIKEFKPDLAIGVGGYASGPIIRSAAKYGIPIVLQEQNSYAGITNKILAKKASIICVAYHNMEKYFPKEKIILTGNPVRNIEISDAQRKAGLAHFNLLPDLPVLVIVGGSLGARSINEAIVENIGFFEKQKLQILWQTGKYYYQEMAKRVKSGYRSNIHILDFITRMDLAYNVADLMISRAGAISISEICLAGQAVVLIPSPNVAEDHQTKNAMALVEQNAAVMIPDKNVKKDLINKVMELVDKIEIRDELARNAKRLAMPNSTALIVDEVNNLIKR